MQLSVSVIVSNTTVSVLGVMKTYHSVLIYWYIWCHCCSRTGSEWIEINYTDPTTASSAATLWSLFTHESISNLSKNKKTTTSPNWIDLFYSPNFLFIPSPLLTRILFRPQSLWHEGRVQCLMLFVLYSCLISLYKNLWWHSLPSIKYS